MWEDEIYEVKWGGILRNMKDIFAGLYLYNSSIVANKVTMLEVGES